MNNAKKIFIGIVAIALVVCAIPLVLVIAGIIIAFMCVLDQYLKVVEKDGRFDYLG